MTTSFDCIAKLSAQDLLDHFADLVVHDRRTTAELLVAIAEIDERKLWATHACSSMFTFCLERFHMSEPMTAKRIWAARTARRFPVILEMVARGELHLGAIHLLAKHLTEQNYARVLERARQKSCREVERLVAELAPQADVSSRIRALPGPRRAAVAASVDGTFVDGVSSDETSANGGEAPRVDGPVAAFADGISSEEAESNIDSIGGASHWPAPATGARNARIPGTPESRPDAKPIVALSPRRYKIEVTVDEATHDKLRSLQDLLIHTETGRDPAAIISRAIDVLLVRTLARKAACTERPKPTKPATSATPTTSATPSTSAMLASANPFGPTTPASDIAAADRSRRSRNIPAAVRREVWRRDAGRCCYSDARGRRCRETSNVEFHHKTPFALGGPPTVENLELRCAAHNQLQADLDFGRSFMDARRENVASVRTFHVECRR